MKINIFLFDDFETLDVFGPVEIFGKTKEFELDYFSVNGGFIKSAQGTKILTKDYREIDILSKNVLLIPGGMGTRTLINDENIIKIIKQLSSKSTFTLTVCTGSALLAKTGLLDNKIATSNKKAWEWVISVNQNVKWQKNARWCDDGKFYTSSGVSAGIDMSLGFISDILGYEKAKMIANMIEYIWNEDKQNDPFAIK